MTFSAVERSVDGPVATLRIKPFERTQAEGSRHPGFVDVHTGIALALEEWRFDDAVRVVVITGSEDGEFYWPPAEGYYDRERLDRMNPLRRPPGRWSHQQGATRIAETLLFMDKPVIARVNGHAASNGQSIIFASDLVVAWEDAVIADNHLGLLEVRGPDGVAHGQPFSMSPGDGSGALVPLFLAPTRAKEYFFVSPAYTARELAAMRIVNYAVPMDRLDPVVDGLVERLLRRPARTLARTKRAVNKRLVAQFQLVQDALASSLQLDFFELGRDDWVDDRTLGPTGRDG